jgi:hypothetical protein
MDLSLDQLSLLPSQEFENLSPLLADRVLRTAAMLNEKNLGPFLDSTMKELLKRSFQAAGAHEGAVWLVDREQKHLVISYGWGPHAEVALGFRQPLDRGIVSMVFAMEQTFCENKVYANRLQARSLDQQLGILTCSMIAVPLTFARSLRGVVSCIRVKKDPDAPDPEDFAPGALASVQFATHLLGKLLEFEIVGLITGWDNGL